MTQTRRIVILAEGKFNPLAAKTAAGVIRYSPHEILAVIDSTLVGKTVQEVLGYGGDVPVVAKLSDVLDKKPDTLLIGIAPTGGQLPDDMRQAVRDAIANKLDVWSGLHQFLSNDVEFARLAQEAGVRLWDVRKPAENLEVGMARALNAKALVVLAIGSDCNVGKMTAALELQKVAKSAGYKAAFVATGQTGILIEGDGTPLDAIPGDFMAGEVERLVMAADAEGADVIFVEGQGALIHPGFGPVTLGLMLGAMPDAFVLVHQVSRQKFRPGYDVDLPSLRETLDGYHVVMRYLKGTKTIGACLNTYDLDEATAMKAIADVEADLGLPTCDPFRTGVQNVWAALEPLIRAKRG